MIATPLPAEGVARDERRTAGLIALALVCIGACYLVDHNWLFSTWQAFTVSGMEKVASIAQGSLRRQAGFLLAGALGLIALLWPARQRVCSACPAAWLAAIGIAWVVASCIWSADGGVSVRRVAALLCVVLAAAGVARHLRPAEIALMVVFASSGFVALGLAAEVVHGTWHPGDATYRFSGTLHPNSQGQNCAVLCMAALALAWQRPGARGRWAALAGAAMVLLLLTRSRTSLARPAIAPCAKRKANGSPSSTTTNWPNPTGCCGCSSLPPSGPCGAWGARGCSPCPMTHSPGSPARSARYWAKWRRRPTAADASRYWLPGAC